jgi:hypothetical protein
MSAAKQVAVHQHAALYSVFFTEELRHSFVDVILIMSILRT